jgi:hypothetical protein
VECGEQRKKLEKKVEEEEANYEAARASLQQETQVFFKRKCRRLRYSSSANAPITSPPLHLYRSTVLISGFHVSSSVPRLYPLDRKS